MAEGIPLRRPTSAGPAETSTRRGRSLTLNALTIGRSIFDESFEALRRFQCAFDRIESETRDFEARALLFLLATEIGHAKDVWETRHKSDVKATLDPAFRLLTDLTRLLNEHSVDLNAEILNLFIELLLIERSIQDL